MLNKFINLVIRERKYSVGFIMVVIAILGSLLLGKIQKMQAAQITTINAKLQLIAQIPEFKKQIEYLEKLQLEKSKNEEEKGPVLKGILMANNINYAIIGDTFYQEGESCGNFTILKIALDYVIIVNKNTKQRKILYLY